MQVLGFNYEVIDGVVASYTLCRLFFYKKIIIKTFSTGTLEF